MTERRALVNSNDASNYGSASTVDDYILYDIKENSSFAKDSKVQRSKDPSPSKPLKKKLSKVFSQPSLISLARVNEMLNIDNDDDVYNPEVSSPRPSVQDATGKFKHRPRHTLDHKVPVLAYNETFNMPPQIPSNYMDPKGNFPAKDAYIDSIKSQFFSLGFTFGSSFQ
jgi:hypothetical protein